MYHIRHTYHIIQFSTLVTKNFKKHPIINWPVIANSKCIFQCFIIKYSYIKIKKNYKVLNFLCCKPRNPHSIISIICESQIYS